MRNKKKPAIKSRLFANVRRMNPFLVIRILFMWALLSPWFLFTLALSWLKMLRWKKPETSQAFIKRHKLAFEHIRPHDVKVETLAGGVNNFNQLWHCNTWDGRKITYFVKTFMDLGSFWARNMSLVSPFPVIYGASTRERFSTDTVCRVALANLKLNVPGLIAFDPVEQVIVMEYIEGSNVDTVLEEIAQKNEISEVHAEMIRQCGVGLGQIHREGYALIDTQPVNCLWVESQRKVYFTDLEFCTREDKRIWDVGFFMCFLAVRLPENLKSKASDYFLDSYETERGIDLSELEETRSSMREYLPVFQTILDIRKFTPEELFEELITNPL